MITVPVVTHDDPASFPMIPDQNVSYVTIPK